MQIPLNLGLRKRNCQKLTGSVTKSVETWLGATACQKQYVTKVAIVMKSRSLVVSIALETLVPVHLMRRARRDVDVTSGRYVALVVIETCVFVPRERNVRMVVGVTTVNKSVLIVGRRFRTKLHIVFKRSLMTSL